MAGDLERKLGELMGAISSAIPKLDGLEVRMNALDREIGQVSQKVDRSEKDITDIETGERGCRKELFTRIATEDEKIWEAVRGLKEDVSALTTQMKGVAGFQKTLGDRAWDIVKLLIPPIVASLGTYWIMSSGGVG